MRRFTSQFVRPGHLVFDVGANRGEYSEMYAALGASVVAVEPNPELVEIVRARVPNAIVEEAAVGAVEGTADLWRGADDGDSTLSKEYRAVLARTIHATMHPLRVRVTTLDSLIARHGVPHFVKIDVEGFEEAVLRGLTARPAALSFEFHAALLGELEKCLTRLPDYQFRIAVGYDFSWQTEWVGAGAILHRARELSDGEPSLFGDVYALDTLLE